jgi:large subunit ribosomal protein L3
MMLARKKNMTQVFDESKNVVPVTILDYSETFVVKGQKNSGNFIGIGKKLHAGKAQTGMFGEIVPEFSKQIDSEITELEVLSIGDSIDLIGTSKGKGFAGVMRMWNFRGGKRTHGQSDRERHGGSIGSRIIPGRVFKGKRMGRRKGSEIVTIKGLKVVAVDLDNKTISVNGSVPGSYDSIVEIIKK